MARGATLSQMISDLRDELRRANSSSAGPDDVGSLRRTLNHVYRLLYYSHDWSFLKTRFPAITFNTGQRYYDFPAGLDPDRITDVKLAWSGNFVDIERGIDIADFNAFDPEADERTSPAIKWDVTFTGTKEQIEIWPLPDSTAQSLRFTGVYACSELIDNDDRCRLESELVVLFAAAELLKAQKSEDADAKLAQAQSLLSLIKLRSTSAGGKSYRVGLGSGEPEKLNPRTTVRIGG